MKIGDLVEIQYNNVAWHGMTATVERLAATGDQAARVFVNEAQASKQGLGPNWGHFNLAVLGNVGDEEAKLAAYINGHDGNVPPGY